MNWKMNLTELNEILGKGNQQKTVFENSKDFSGLYWKVKQQMLLLHKLTVFYREFGHWEMSDQGTCALISIFSQSTVAMSFAIFAPDLVFPSPLWHLSSKAQIISENGLNNSSIFDINCFFTKIVNFISPRAHPSILYYNYNICAL